jgi:hypothetical protein
VTYTVVARVICSLFSSTDNLLFNRTYFRPTAQEDAGVVQFISFEGSTRVRKASVRSGVKDCVSALKTTKRLFIELADERSNASDKSRIVSLDEKNRNWRCPQRLATVYTTE